MKQILFALLALLSTTVFAAYQYEFGKISGATNDYKNNNGTYAAYADRAGAFGLQNALHFKQDGYLFINIGKGTVSEFGAYLLDGSSIAREYTFKAVSGTEGLFAASAGNDFVQFNSGDSVGFWITDAAGKKIYNTPKVQGGNTHTYNGTSITGGNTVYANGFGQYGEYISSGAGYEQMFADSTYVMDVMVGAEKPSGQPLPGLLATLLIGSGSLAMIRFRGNKKSR